MTVRNHLFMTEVVTGICPSCSFPATLIGLDASLYRCTRCGDELEQKRNGVIKYIVANKNTRLKVSEHFNGHDKKG